MRDPREFIAAQVLEHVDETVPATDVETLARRVVEEIVGVPDNLERLALLSRRGVEYESLRRPPTADEQSMIRFIERHRVVCPGRRDRPCADDFH
jgi:hypothetical protein